MSEYTWRELEIIRAMRVHDNLVVHCPNTKQISRYANMFSTPKRAARTLARACDECSDKFPCWECPLSPIIGSNVYEPEILEWLRGDAE